MDCFLRSFTLAAKIWGIKSVGEIPTPTPRDWAVEFAKKHGLDYSFDVRDVPYGIPLIAGYIMMGHQSHGLVNGHAVFVSDTLVLSDKEVVFVIWKKGDNKENLLTKLKRLVKMLMSYS